MNKTICHLIINTGVGGAELAMMRLMRETMHNYNHILISMMAKEKVGKKIENYGIKVIELGISKNPITFFRMAKIFKIIHNEKPNLIISWMYHANLISLLLSPFYKVIWNIRHSLDDIKREKKLTRLLIYILGWLSKVPLKIIFNSTRSKNQHCNILNYTERNSEVIHNGVNIQEFYPNNKIRREKRKELNLLNDDIVIGHAARFHPVKNHTIFLKAFKAVSVRNPRVKAILCGRGVSMENLEFKQIIYKYKIEDKVICLGELKNLNEFYNTLDLFVLSSNSEGFPNVLIEAMSCGIRVVSTNVGEVHKVIQNKDYIVPPRNYKLLEGAINSVIKMKNDIIISNQINNRNIVVNRFNSLTSTKLFINIISSIISLKKNS